MSYGNLLDANEFKGSGAVFIVLETELDDFADALHEGVERPGLRVATAQGGNGGDVEACFVLLDENGKFLFRLHSLNLFQEVYQKGCRQDE